MSPPSKIDLSAALASFDERWSPRIVAAVDEHHVKLAKLEGPFEWHRHEHEDELFLVLKGRLTLRFRDGDVALEPGQLLVVPRGVEHLPVADGETHVLLFERATTVNTGDRPSERTVAPRWL